MLTPTLTAPTIEETNAEVLLWQARYRAILLPLIGFSTIALKWFALISSDSVLSGTYGQRQLLGIALGLMMAYLRFTAASRSP